MHIVYYAYCICFLYCTCSRKREFGYILVKRKIMLLTLLFHILMPSIHPLEYSFKTPDITIAHKSQLDATIVTGLEFPLSYYFIFPIRFSKNIKCNVRIAFFGYLTNISLQQYINKYRRHSERNANNVTSALIYC